MSTSAGGSTSLKWIEKPWPNSSRLPGATPSAISLRQTSPCFSSGSSTITTSPREAASAMPVTSSPAPRAFSTDAEPLRRPTTTSTPESLRLSECAWP